MSKYKILSRDNRTQLFINEEEVQLLKSIEFIHKDGNSLPVLRAEVYMIDKNELEIDVDNENEMSKEITTLDKLYKEVFM